MALALNKPQRLTCYEIKKPTQLLSYYIYIYIYIYIYVYIYIYLISIFDGLVWFGLLGFMAYHPL